MERDSRGERTRLGAGLFVGSRGEGGVEMTPSAAPRFSRERGRRLAANSDTSYLGHKQPPGTLLRHRLAAASDSSPPPFSQGVDLTLYWLLAHGSLPQSAQACQERRGGAGLPQKACKEGRKGWRKKPVQQTRTKEQGREEERP